MPLEQGSSPATVSKNIETERHAGKPEAQAVAIAESEARRTGQSDASAEARIMGIGGVITTREIAERNRRYWEPEKNGDAGVK